MIRIVCVAALLLMAPGVALADPINIIATLAPYIGGTAASAVATAAVFVSTYGGYIYAAAQVYGGIQSRRRAKKASAAARAAYNEGLTDRMALLLRADPPWRVVYGRAITGGDILANFVSDKDGLRDDGSTYTRPDAYRHIIIHCATHEVEAINDVLIDGEPVGALDGSGWATGGTFGGVTRTIYQERTLGPGQAAAFPAAPTVLHHVHYPTGNGDAQTASYTLVGNTVTNTSGLVTSLSVSYTQTQALVRVEKLLGTDGQTASAWLQSVCPEYASTDRLQGVAGVILTLDLEEPRFQSGPPQIHVDVSGRKVFDPRTSTTAWTRNPALIVRDWLVQPFGMGVDAADIDDAAVIAAANVCDQTVALDVGGTVTNEARYTADGATSTEALPEAVLDELTDAMAGGATQTGGLWVVTAGAYTAPVMALTDDTLHGSISIVQAGAAHGEAFNSVTARMLPAGATVDTEADPYSNAAYVTADGRELWDDVVLPWTNHRARARNLLRIRVESNREAQVIRYPAKLHAWGLQVGDRVTVTSAEYGFSAKPFRVTDWDFGVTSPVVLTLQEDAAAIYDLADAATADQAPNTGLPDPWAVPAITGLALAGGDAHAVLVDKTRLPRLRVTWDVVASVYVQSGGAIDLEWRRLGLDALDAWHAAALPGTAVAEYVGGVRAGDAVIVRVRARTELGGAGVWALAVIVVPAVTPSSLTDYGYTGDLNATAGATWGSNIAGQPADTDLINSYAVAAADAANAAGEGGYANPDPFITRPGADWLFINVVGNNPNFYPAFNAGAGFQNAWDKLDGGKAEIFGPSFPIDPNKSYHIETKLWINTGGGSMIHYFGVAFYDGNWNVVTSGNWPANGTYGYFGLLGTSAPVGTSTYALDFGAGQTATIPATAVRARVLILGDYNNGGVRWAWGGARVTDYAGDFNATYGATAAQAADIAAALSTAATAQATADGKIDSFWQVSAPGTASEGDIWFDTDDGNRQYRWTSGAWVLAADTRIGTAISNAATAQATADGKVVTFVQGTTPTAEGVGDLWIDTANGNRMTRWSGSAWVAYAINTGGLATGAATETVSNSGASGSYSIPTGSTLSYVYFPVWAKWTNTTGATVEVDYVGYCEGARGTGDPAGSTKGLVYAAVLGADPADFTSTDGDQIVGNQLEDVATDYTRFFRAGRVSVADGSTVYVYVRVCGVRNSGSARTIYWRDAQVTLAAIKR